MAQPAIRLDGGVMVATWNLDISEDEGGWLVLPYHTDICLQVYGTFGAGATINFEGCNQYDEDVDVAFPVFDFGGSAIALTAAGGVQCQQAPYKVRPTLTGGDGSTAITVFVKASRVR